MKKQLQYNRRALLQALPILLILPCAPTFASKNDAMDAMQKIIGGTPVKDGGIYFELSPLIENGNSVPIKIEVESPMTSQNYVKAIHVISEDNPLPNIFSAYLTPQSGKAKIATRVRLANTQRVWVLAEMSQGYYARTFADTNVTLAACFEG
ncbi:MAG: sulfur oxidation protein SoxY [Polynucleobacter sp.]|jgi:sulfur-oxidizing protein SoxY|nr:sulfur oxidation protein SoxY [Polynucleobacter sp.]